MTEGVFVAGCGSGEGADEVAGPPQPSSRATIATATMTDMRLKFGFSCGEWNGIAEHPAPDGPLPERQGINSREGRPLVASGSWTMSSP
jgi:hypothetical protein